MQASMSQARSILVSALKADQVVYLEGPPGVGKSDLVEETAKSIGLPMVPLYLSQRDVTDVVGLPVVDGGSLVFKPIGPIREAMDHACVLFLDEFPDAPALVQGAAQSLVLTRKVEGGKLHKDTRIVLAGNPVEMSSGGSGRTLPMVGRSTRVSLAPTIAEFQEWLRRSPEPWAHDLAGTLEARPDLLQIIPPPGSVSSGSAWGAPRNWARAIALASQLEKDGADREVLAIAISGSVGEEIALAYMAIRDLRNDLPTMPEIIKDPEGCKTPDSSKIGVGVIGILGCVAQSAPCEAWIYASRLKDETRICAFRALLSYPLAPGAKSKWYAKATQARTLMIAKNASLLNGGKN